MVSPLLQKRRRRDEADSMKTTIGKERSSPTREGARDRDRGRGRSARTMARAGLLAGGYGSG